MDNVKEENKGAKIPLKNNQTPAQTNKTKKKLRRFLHCGKPQKFNFFQLMQLNFTVVPHFSTVQEDHIFFRFYKSITIIIIDNFLIIIIRDRDHRTNNFVQHLCGPRDAVQALVWIVRLI